MDLWFSLMIFYFHHYSPPGTGQIFSSKKFDTTYERTKEEAREYISKNIDEYKLLITSDWVLSNIYF